MRAPPIPAPDPNRADRLQRVIARVMRVEDTTLGGGDEPFVMRFRGRLLEDSWVAYDRVDNGVRPDGLMPLFRLEGDQHVVLLVPRHVPQPSSPVWNLVLLVATALAVLFTGATMQEGVQSLSDGWRHLADGWPFAVSLLGILGAHELGHYVMARRHRVAVTLPYFLPFPAPLSPFGTLGAFIRLKGPPRNRRQLLDIAIAGPLAGLVIAVPVLIVGLMLSRVEPIPAAVPAGSALSFEGNSILYAAIKYLVFGEWLPVPASGIEPSPVFWLRYLFGLPAPLGGRDVFLHPVAWAGWSGLLVTGLNLIPAGQLDGGHVLYVLLGRRVRRLVPFIVGGLAALGLLWSGWFLWAFLIYTLGWTHAEVLDQITPLDRTRKALAVLGLVIFVLVFTPIPLRVFQAG